jgi:hypothetical protein
VAYDFTENYYYSPGICPVGSQLHVRLGGQRSALAYKHPSVVLRECHHLEQIED